MVMTILEARVKAENWTVLEDDYKKRTVQLPPQMIETFLVQDTADRTLWRIITVWKSREALDGIRNSSETPAGVVMFRNAGTEPELSIFNVPASAP